ncbi:hypothetical protein FKG94_13630 [Exilibacterium tricleocarpae]|uniref:Uncharacterized protein n=1 Tax=Exilibacterium tricleocarpae TaxID=2591008 RepID=A0A545TLK4_9GAMM|nr:hypothetical protein [Exilibacterium tricleocarpae]TQV78115.1 hypothetical protein FKG94_13630 [Exilibacterium tricleocarpae]
MTTVTVGGPDEAAIDIGERAVANAKIDVDSREIVTVWPGAPKKDQGMFIYPVEKVAPQSLHNLTGPPTTTR